MTNSLFTLYIFYQVLKKEKYREGAMRERASERQKKRGYVAKREGEAP